MIKTSELYKRLFAAGAKAEVALAIGRGPELAREDKKTLVIGGATICAGPDPSKWLREDMIESITVTQRAVGSGAVSVGGALSGEIDVVLLATDVEIPRQARLRPYVRLTDGEETSEWIPQGVFFLDTREIDAPDGLRKLTLHGYDAMLRGEQSYTESFLGWPAAAGDVVREIAGRIGVQVDLRTDRMLADGYQILNPEGYSCREILSEIAGIYGGNFVISADGRLLLVPIWGLDGENDPPDLSNAICGDYTTDEPILWDRVEMSLDDVVSITAGPGEHQTLRAECRSGTMTAAKRLVGRLQTRPYQPFSAKTVLLDPAAELGDRLLLPDGDGNLMAYARNLGLMCVTDIESPGDEDLTHEYSFSTTQDRQETRRYRQLRTDLETLSNTVRELGNKNGM